MGTRNVAEVAEVAKVAVLAESVVDRAGNLALLVLVVVGVLVALVVIAFVARRWGPQIGIAAVVVMIISYLKNGAIFSGQHAGIIAFACGALGFLAFAFWYLDEDRM